MLLLLDLFCGQGGAGAGYARAGFRVVGVDTAPIAARRYPFRIHQTDALDFLRAHGREFDAIHASPPCHDHSSLRSRSGRDGSGWLLHATRRALVETGRPYIIENVPRSPMFEPLVLCGSMFGLGAACSGQWRSLRRHRLFEVSGFEVAPPKPCDHGGPVVGVYGGGGGGQQPRGYLGSDAERRAAMGIDWMTRAGLSQAIPPAYTEHIGRALRAELREEVA